MTLDELIPTLRRACQTVGTITAWAGQHGVSKVVVGRVLNGVEKPGPKLLAAMGLRKVETYEVVE